MPDNRRNRTLALTISGDDTDVAWARRQEGIRGILKLIRIMTLAARTHATRTEQLGRITAPQLWALRELDRAPGLRVKDLARIMAVHATDVRALLADLMARGLVREMSSPDDHAHRLALTEAGKDMLEAAPGPAQGVVLAALETLDDPSLLRLADALGLLVAAMPCTDGSAAFKPLADCCNA